MVNSRNCILNVGDKTGLEFYQNYLTEALCYSREKCEQVNNLIYAENVTFKKSGVEFDVNGKYGKAHFCSKLLGSFNIENLLCAISILLLKGYKLEQLAKYSNELTPIKGRMECFKGYETPLSVVDYAHTPDGLEKALQALREHSFGRIITVVGCGGDRDTGKRPNMAKIACQNSDYVIFTTDNPRTEQPENILKMMVDGVVSDYQNYEQVIDRKQAIVKAYNKATKDDVILVAGKGHEDYQIIGKTKHHFSDREIVSELCGL
jgi:UDP-N-acetylmuramoyl-L-alanyl-D-glutamate--2,6-diaminopimelate ligase